MSAVHHAAALGGPRSCDLLGFASNGTTAP